MCLYHVIGLHTTANTMVGLDRYHTGDWYRILSTGAVSILEMMLHSSDICTILTTHGRRIMLTATSSSEMCGDDFAVTLHGRRRFCRHGELTSIMMTLPGHMVTSSLSCRVYCNQTNQRQWLRSQYTHMASWLCMCTVNGVVAFNKLDYEGWAMHVVWAVL